MGFLIWKTPSLIYKKWLLWRENDKDVVADLNQKQLKGKQKPRSSFFFVTSAYLKATETNTSVSVLLPQTHPAWTTSLVRRHGWELRCRTPPWKRPFRQLTRAISRLPFVSGSLPVSMTALDFFFTTAVFKQFVFVKKWTGSQLLKCYSLTAQIQCTRTVQWLLKLREPAPFLSLRKLKLIHRKSRLWNTKTSPLRRH